MTDEEMPHKEVRDSRGGRWLVPTSDPAYFVELGEDGAADIYANDPTVLSRPLGAINTDTIIVPAMVFKSEYDAKCEEVDQLREAKKQLEAKAEAAMHNLKQVFILSDELKLLVERERALHREMFLEVQKSARKVSREAKRAKRDLKEARGNAVMYRALLETLLVHGYIDLPDPDHKDVIPN